MTFTDPYRTIIVEPVELPSEPQPDEAPTPEQPDRAPQPAERPAREKAPAKGEGKRARVVS